MELDHLAGGYRFGAQGFELLLAAVNPHDLVGGEQFYLVVDPVKNRFVLC